MQSIHDYASISLVILGAISLVTAYAAYRQSKQIGLLRSEAQRRAYEYKAGSNPQWPLTFSLLHEGLGSSKTSKRLRAPVDAYPLVMWPIIKIGGFIAVLAISFLLFMTFGRTGYAFLIALYGFLLILWKFNIVETSAFLSAISKAGIETLDNRDEPLLKDVEYASKWNVRYFTALGIAFLAASILISTRIV